MTVDVAAARTHLVLALCLIAPPAFAATAAIHGTTTTANRTTRLPGVEVTVSQLAVARRSATVVSDGNGRFELRDLVPGPYRIVARLAGFTDLAREPVILADGQDLQLDFDLVVAPVTEHVDVVAEAGLVQTSVAPDTVKGKMIDFLPVSGDSFRALLPVMPGVIRAPDGRMSLKGAQETQGAFQVGRGYASDPSTGNFGIELPADSIESVEVLANPYAAQDGRFSSTVVRIETKPGDNDWHALANGFVPLPCLKICDGESVGVRNYHPRGWFGGPLVKDRLFIAQGIQGRFVRVRVPSLPDEENDTTDRGVETFTRVDANLSAGHTMTATLAIFPRRTSYVGLNTFLPQIAAPDLRFVGSSASVSDSATVTPSLLLESSFAASFYDVDVFGQADAPQELTIDGAAGNFFNRQKRRTRVLQWTETITGVRRGVTGEHVLRAGVDVLWASYHGTNASSPVVVRRADGTVSQRFDFGSPTAQQADAADVGVFAQDRWRIAPRLLLEPGLRLERDGVTRRTNLSPRIGFVAGVLSNDVGVLRGGVGVFYERTPLNVAAFESFETAVLTRFGSDGVTPQSPPIAFLHRTAPLLTPRSVIWNVEYDHRIRPDLVLKINHLRRSGDNLAMLDPIETGGTGELLLDSHGRSRYSETEVTLRLGATDLQEVAISYVRSHAMTNLNAFDNYFGGFRNPIVRPDQYSIGPTDVPNRLLVRAVATVRDKWTLSSLIEARTGFPYSRIDQDQLFVGVRNAGGRFPNVFTVDGSIVRSMKVRKRPVRFGVRVYHLLDTRMLRDVQNNVDSPAFGTFYNSIPRKVAVTFTFLSR